MITKKQAAAEYYARRIARRDIANYARYTQPDYKWSFFSEDVCRHLGQFLVDVESGKRPIIVFQAPPQHGKSELVSRKLPAFILGRDASRRLGAASYSADLAGDMATDVRRNLASEGHARLFPVDAQARSKYDRDTLTKFTAPGGKGGYVGVGVGGGLTGKPVDIGIIDDPIKNQQEALSQTTKESHWNWYQSTFTTRLSENSGQIIMATQWAEDDLPSRIIKQFRGDPRLKILRYPALNEPGETGYNPDLPIGALVPLLHSREKLLETKALMSDYWWSAMYQQCAKPAGGNVFKGKAKYYWPRDLPEKFDKIIASWDCAFKDTDGSDFVVGQVWGKRGANAYLLEQVRGRMSFTATKNAVRDLANKWRPRGLREVLIEDKANGPAVIDSLKSEIPGIIPVEPDGSKLARAHAITWLWEAGNVYFPHPDFAKFVQDDLEPEIEWFPNGANDDQVDSMTQALRHLFPLRGILRVSEAAIAAAMLP